MDIQELKKKAEVGKCSIKDIEDLCKLYKNRYKIGGKKINDFADWQLHLEYLRKLKSEENTTSVSFEIAAKIEYHNTKVFMNALRMILRIIESKNDVTKPQFYGQPNCDYIVSMETIVHIIIRHNHTINKFVSSESRTNGYNPSSFTFGVLAEPMMLLFMALRVLKKR